DALDLLVLSWNPGRGERCLGWPGSVVDRDGRIGRLLAWMVQPGIGVRLATLLAETAVAAYQEAAGGSEDALIAEVRRYLVEHLPEPIRLDALAACVHLSRSHSARHFRRLAGRPPMRMVTALRVEAARDLLLASDLPLRAIAAR